MKSNREPGLDTARAIATTAMVFGHSLDALLDWSLRGNPWVATYWKFRGLTAPMFLFVSGWAVATVVSRSRATGLSVLGARWKRIALLFACGLLLRLPTWGWTQLLAGNESVWRHTIGFDALHCVAASMLVGCLLLSVFSSPRGRMLSLLGTAAFAILAAPSVWSLMGSAPFFLQEWFGGGVSVFTLLPWSAYFLTGAVVGVWSSTGVEAQKRALLLTGAGLVLFASGYSVATLDPVQSEPRLVALRLGQLLVFTAALGLLPRRLGDTLAPIGKASLGVYVLHIPIVYGWGSFPGLWKRIGPTLSPLQALGVGLVLFLFSFALTELWSRLVKPWVKGRLALLRKREAPQAIAVESSP